MANYINVDKIEYTEEYLSGGFQPTMLVRKSDIDKMPTIKFDGFEKILEAYKNSTYICSSCGKVIFPDVNITDEGFYFHSEKNNYLGKGGKVILDNICPTCKLSDEKAEINPIKKLPNGYIGCIKCGTVFDVGKDHCPGCGQPRYY